MGASTLIGDKVVNSRGEDLGKLEEIMIDMNTGRVRYGVLSFGGILGFGDKLFGIPFDQLELDTENKRIVCDIERDKLERAPGFDKHDWPTRSREFSQEIDSYYGVTGWEGSRLEGREDTETRLP